MVDKNMLPLGAAIAADVMSAIMVPGGNTLTVVAQEYVKKKHQEAAEVLIEELKDGGFHGHVPFDEHDLDPMLEIFFRFSRAVETGAAKDNLRLLAQVIAGLKKHRALDGDKFRKWAGILENLTRDELLVIGTACRIRRQMIAESSAANDFWQRLKPALEKAGYDKLVVDALCASVSRTGLLVPLSAFGGMVYMDTPWLAELGEFADLENQAKPK